MGQACGKDACLTSQPLGSDSLEQGRQAIAFPPSRTFSTALTSAIGGSKTFPAGLEGWPESSEASQSMGARPGSFQPASHCSIEEKPSPSHTKVKVKLHQVPKPHQTQEEPEQICTKTSIRLDSSSAGEDGTVSEQGALAGADLPVFRIASLNDRNSRSIVNKSSSLQEDRSVSVGIDTNKNAEDLLQNNQDFMSYVHSVRHREALKSQQTSKESGSCVSGATRRALPGSTKDGKQGSSTFVTNRRSAADQKH